MALDHIKAQYNEVLTKSAYALLEDQMDFACVNDAIPMIPTTIRNGNYKVFKASDVRRRHAELRAGGTEFKNVNTQLEDKSFACKQRGYEENVDDLDRVENHMESLSEIMMENGMATYDIELATKLTTGVFGADKTGGSSFTKWSDPSSTPIKNIDDYKAEIKAKIGTNPDSLIITQDVFSALKNNTEILGRLKTTEDKKLTLEKLAFFFDLKNVYLMASAQTTTNQGQATQTISNIKSDIALLYFRGLGNGPVAPTTIKCYYNTQTYGAGTKGIILQDYRKEHITSDCLRLVLDFDIVVSMPEGGIFLTDVV